MDEQMKSISPYNSNKITQLLYKNAEINDHQNDAIRSVNKLLYLTSLPHDTSVN